MKINLFNIRNIISIRSKRSLENLKHSSHYEINGALTNLHRSLSSVRSTLERDPTQKRPGADGSTPPSM